MSKEQCYPCSQNQLKFLVSRSFFTELSKEVSYKQTMNVACAWFLGPRFPISVQLHQQEQHWQSEHGKHPWDGGTLTKPPFPSAGNRTRHLHCHIHTDSTQQSQPVGFPLVYHLISSPQPNWTIRVTGEGRKSALFLPLHPSSFPLPSLLPHLNQSKAAGVESQIKGQKIGNMEKACNKRGLLIPSWGSRVIIHTLHRVIETIGLLTQFQTLMKCISYTPTATWRRKKSKICWCSLIRTWWENHS